MFLLLCLLAQDVPVIPITPVVKTAAVKNDADDPAVWLNRRQPAASLIIGTNKVKAPDGALAVFDLAGQLKFTFSGLDRPNNIDVGYALKLQNQLVDIAVTTERLQKQLRIFRINPEGTLVDITSIPHTRMFDGQSPENAEPMGIALWRRASDGAMFAFVSRRRGPADAYLWQYRLEDDGLGLVRAVKVREFGRFTGAGQIEAIAVDAPTNRVFYAEEDGGIHEYHADPRHPHAAEELSFFAREPYAGNREGIAVIDGYILVTNQKPGGSDYHVYLRDGDRSKPLAILRGTADSTDGLDAVNWHLGPTFPRGLVAAMNSSGKNFFLYRWDTIRASLEKLRRR
jgi:3-phytase